MEKRNGKSNVVHIRSSTVVDKELRAWLKYSSEIRTPMRAEAFAKVRLGHGTSGTRNGYWET